MYLLFFKTSNLLLLLYSLLFIKTVTYSLAIDFFSHSLVYELNNELLLIAHPIVDIWQSFRNGLRLKRKEKHLYIRKCNKVIK